jgi:exodeoxyribonuclease III
MVTSGLSFLTFNIGNPSEQRAQRQLAWLACRPEHVLVLTETKASAGCRLLAGAFATAGCHVSFPVPGPGEYGTMIISRVHAAPGDFIAALGYLPARAASVTLPAPDGNIQVIGAYVPSRDAGLEKTERKRKWLAACLAALTARDQSVPAVLLGDLNILEPGHQPHYPFFIPFEYDFYRALTAEHGLTDAFRHLHPAAAEHSWVGRTGDGYRYDHAFCSAGLTPAISTCEYLHEPRHDRLSDHSALTAGFTLQPPAALAVTSPVTAAEPATLF